MIWGYTRASSKQQKVDRGIAEITRYINENYKNVKYKIFYDKQTGKNFDRKQYPILKEVVSEGDILIITELDRLGRNKQSTLEELKFFKEKGVTVKILEIPTTLIDFSSLGNELSEIIISTINNILIEMYAIGAQAEIEKREKRQREGIDLMKEKGAWAKYGRPQIVTEKQFKLAYKEVESGDITAIACARRLGIGKTTFYNLRKKYINV